MATNTGYTGTLIQKPKVDAVRGALPDYEVMLVAILKAILDRFEAHPEYRFVDTKLSIFTGQDFPEPDDPSTDIRGRTAIYGAIQGRGLEALVGHIKWLPCCSVLGEDDKADLVRRLTAMVASVFEQMEILRQRNHGCLPFLMTPEGEPFAVGADGRRQHYVLSGDATSVVDVFYAKGMLAAAMLLGQQSKVAEARHLMRTIAKDLIADWPSTEKGRSTTPGPHGSGMLAIGAFALYAELLDEPEWYELGAQFIRHTLECHVNRGQFEDLGLYDHTELIGSDGAPWVDDRGQILLDPGHCLEFVGLASKLLLLMLERERRSAWDEALIGECQEALPPILDRSFERGFNRRIGGIHKSVDLLSGMPIDSDMPWWSLPETMRAAAELMLLCPSLVDSPGLLQIIADCSNAFVTNYVRPEVHLMAYQTIDAYGAPVDVIPLTSDLDPGYHTGLSILDFMRCMGALPKTER